MWKNTLIETYVESVECSKANFSDTYEVMTYSLKNKTFFSVDNMLLIHRWAKKNLLIVL